MPLRRSARSTPLTTLATEIPLQTCQQRLSTTPSVPSRQRQASHFQPRFRSRQRLCRLCFRETKGSVNGSRDNYLENRRLPPIQIVSSVMSNLALQSTGPLLARLLTGANPAALTALALVALYPRGEFVRADAFIAFMGMDVRVRESGQWRGRRKLTKKGDPEIRRLLFNAAMQARRSPLWEPYYLALRQRAD